MEKFGKVYIRGKSGDNLDKLELVKSARFSNLDHKWYDNDGNIHSEYHLNRGKKFTIAFKSSQLDKHGHTVHFQGNIHVPYNLGDILEQDFESVDETEKEDSELVRRYNLISGNITEEKTKQMMEATFLAACYPGCKLRDAKMQRLYNLAFFMFDDHMETFFTGLKLGQLNEFSEIAHKIMYQKLGAIRIDHSSFPNLPESLLDFLKYIQFSEKELSILENGTDRGKYVREATVEYLHATCLETSQEWNENWGKNVDKAQNELRVTASEHGCVLNWHTSWSNDVVSYGKEMQIGRACCNTVYLLHNYRGLSLQDAMQQVLHKIHQCSTLLVETGRMLSELYQDDEMVLRFVNKAKDIAYGNVQYSTLTNRYHEGFCYDCVLEDN
ncbi:unnamed protein product [Orchesella dallaii]|uniref:Uncharacterized protein n=1 Tax=Orchesella dallaii TaxID=48710 RepID=A0ABP1RQU8_9HEXA